MLHLLGNNLSETISNMRILMLFPIIILYEGYHFATKKYVTCVTRSHIQIPKKRKRSVEYVAWENVQRMELDKKHKLIQMHYVVPTQNMTNLTKYFAEKIRKTFEGSYNRSNCWKIYQIEEFERTMTVIGKKHLVQYKELNSFLAYFT